MSTAANTIASYPPPERDLDGSEFVAGWQDGAQRRLTTQAIADLLLPEIAANEGAIGAETARATAAEAAKLNKSGDAMTGELGMGGARISNLGQPLSGLDAANKTYVDSLIATLSGSSADNAAALLAAIVTETAARLAADGLKLDKSAVETNEDAIAGTATDKWVPPAAMKTAITAAINALVNAAPGSLNTLKELADALGDDPNFSATVIAQIATKASSADLTSEISRATGIEAGLRNDLTSTAGRVARGAAVARDAAGVRDIYPGAPAVVDPAGRAVGAIDGQGVMTVGGIQMRTPLPFRDAWRDAVRPLFSDAAGRDIMQVGSDGLVRMPGARFPSGLLARDAWPRQRTPLMRDAADRVFMDVGLDGAIGATIRSPSVASDLVRDVPNFLDGWFDDQGYTNLAIMPDGRMFVALHERSLDYVDPAVLSGAPEGVMAYAVGAAGARTARLWISGYASDLRIATEAEITDILAVSSTRHRIDLLALTASGKRQVSVPLSPPSTLLPTVTSVIQIPVGGQSLAEGQSGQPDITPAPLDPGRAVALTPGERLDATGTVATLNDRATLVGYVDLVAMVTGVQSQTISPTMAHAMLARAPASEGILVTNTAIGGTAFPQRQKGQPPYRNMILGIERGATIARLTGRGHLVPLVIEISGESDGATDAITWAGYLTSHRANVDADVKDINGQTQDVILVTDQMGQGAVGTTLGQLQVAIDDPNHFICVGPKYHLARSDYVHLTALSYDIRGYEFGRAINRKLVDGVNPLPPRIANAVRAGNVITATFVGDFEGHMVIDTTLVSNLPDGNYGITFAQTGGNAVTITGVTLDTSNGLTVTLSATPTGTGQTLLCARLGTASTGGPVSGSRSCFRDQSADTCTIQGTTYPLYRWAAQWETPVTV